MGWFEKRRLRKECAAELLEEIKKSVVSPLFKYKETNYTSNFKEAVNALVDLRLRGKDYSIDFHVSDKWDLPKGYRGEPISLVINKNYCSQMSEYNQTLESLVLKEKEEGTILGAEKFVEDYRKWLAISPEEWGKKVNANQGGCVGPCYGTGEVMRGTYDGGFYNEYCETCKGTGKMDAEQLRNYYRPQDVQRYIDDTITGLRRKKPINLPHPHEQFEVHIKITEKHENNHP